MSTEAKPGDRVRLKTKHEELEGILMPSRDAVVIKLDNGYNIGFERRHVKRITLLAQKKDPLQTPAEARQEGKLPLVTILHTGGTIASKVDYKTGGVSAKFTPAELLEMFPELKNLATIDSRLVANMFSANMNFSHYNLLSEAVEEQIKKGAKAVIITQGTDTIHYTSAALAFALENCPIPVIIVGAQRSSDRGSSDAASNLIAAIAFAVNANYKGVGVCMHKSSDDDACFILNPLKLRKLHTSRRDAFRPINAPPLAEVDYKKRTVKKKGTFTKPEGEFMRHTYKTDLDIGILFSHPQLSANDVQAFEKHDALVLLGTGLGHMPVQKTDDFTAENLAIKAALSKLATNMPVVMTSQCIYGRINMDVYAYGRELQEIGVWGDQLDMTSEAAFIKLAFLLSTTKEKEWKQLFHKDLRGEIAERIEEKTFLV